MSVSGNYAEGLKIFYPDVQVHEGEGINVRFCFAPSKGDFVPQC